jgi:hypothetical protein
MALHKSLILHRFDLVSGHWHRFDLVSYKSPLNDGAACNHPKRIHQLKQLICTQ